MRKISIYFLILPLLICFMACKGTERIVEVPVTKTEYKDRVLEKKDSVYVHDSTYMYVGGDTVYVYQYKNVYRDKLMTDTMYVNRHDSIAVPYPVERELSQWEKGYLLFGKTSFCVLLILSVALIAYVVWHRIRSRLW